MTSPSPEAEIHDILRDMLLSSALPAGMRLGEMELAGAFGVSRERIRKVLHRLGTERLIEQISNRGAFVASPTLSTAREIYDARRMLESGLLLNLADTLTDRQIDELEAHLAAEHEAGHQGDRARMVQLSGEFHLKLAAMSGNAFMVRYIEEMVSRTSMLVALFEHAAPTCSHDEHEQIVGALRQRNGSLAAQMGTVHLSLVETRLKLIEHPAAPEGDLATLVKTRIKSRAPRRGKTAR